MFSLEEVECIGACTGAPAMQVNYDFYENLTHAQIRPHHRAIWTRAESPSREPVISGALHERDKLRDSGDQQALWRQGFAQDRCRICRTTAIRRWKKR